MSPTDGPPLFAVLIGINKYKAIPEQLRGAVADVEMFQRYLEQRLHVPSNQINLLKNEDATRDAIIKALKKLVVDDHIKPGNPIVIYFAGHGTEIEAPAGWECSSPDRKIQAIIPYDGFAEGPGGQVPPIPDRTIGSLLTAISQKRGINITVIFDCCHSGSGTRAHIGLDDEDSVTTTRGVDFEPRVYPDSLDEDIWTDVDSIRGMRVPSQFVYHGLASHVLLAACGAGQKAHEGVDFHLPKYMTPKPTRCGRFSAALLKLLDNLAEEPHQILYPDILNRLERIEGQNPQCEGLHKNRLLFGAKVLPTSRRKSFEVLYQPEANGHRGYYTVKAGRIHNITSSSKFTVYYDSDITLSSPVGLLLVAPESLQDFQVVALPPPGERHFDITSGPRGKAVAFPSPTKFSSAENLQLEIWIDPAYRYLRDHFAHLKTRHANWLQNVFLAATQRMSDIEIKPAPNQTISLEIFTSPAILPLPHSFSWRKGNFLPNDDMLPDTLRQAANFYGELKRADNDPAISRGIGVEFYELVRDYHTDYDNDTGTCPQFTPNFKLNLDHGILKIYTSDQAGGPRDIPYGIKLTNNTNLNLYVNMFYFSNSDLSIAPVLQTDPGSPYIVDVSLPRNSRAPDGTVSPGTLTIGYGESGHRPLGFKLAAGIEIDVDFLKIYLTTHPADLSYLIQPSPFNTSRKAGPYDSSKPVVSWSHIVIPIIQYR